MLFDHIGYIFLESENTMTGVSPASSSINIFIIDMFLRAIGRMAFPIFAFCIAEGCYYTRSRWKYLLRMVIFAVLSQPAFHLVKQCPADSPEFNIMLTFAYAILSVQILESIFLNYIKTTDTHFRIAILRLILSIVLIAGICYISENVTPCDYGVYGVITVLTFYLLRNKKLFACIANELLLFINTVFEIFAIGGLFLIMKYNGRQGRRCKYLFYIFYPGHFFVLLVIKRILFGQ